MPYFVKHHLKQKHRAAETQAPGYEAVAAEIGEAPAQEEVKPPLASLQAVLPAVIDVVAGPQQTPSPPIYSRLPDVSPVPAAVYTSEMPDVPQMTERSRNGSSNLLPHVSRAGDEDAIALILLIILAVLLPPLAVLIVDGLSWSFLLSILLWLLFYIPGLIYALFVIFRAE